MKKLLLIPAFLLAFLPALASAQVVPGGNVRMVAPLQVGNGTATTTISGGTSSGTSATSTFNTGLTVQNLIATTSILTGVASCSGTNALTTKSTGEVICGAVSATAAAGGLSGQVQYNNATAIDGRSLFTFNNSTGQVIVAGALDLGGSSNPGTLSLGNGLIATTTITPGYGRIGFGSTTPYAQYSFESVQGNLLVGSNTPIFVIGDAGTTTPFFVVNWGGVVGIGTSTDNGGEMLSGNGLSVGTSTLFGANLTLSPTSVFKSEATATSTFASGLLLQSQGLGITAGGITITAGDINTAGVIKSSSTASSSLPVLISGTSLSAGLIYESGTATSSFEGGINVKGIGGITSASGLNVSGGDALFSGVIKIASTGTSTNAGTEAINSTTGTSTIAGNLFLSNALLVNGAVHLNMASSTNTGTTTAVADCSLAPRGTFIFDKDGSSMLFKNCFGGDTYTAIIDIPKADFSDNLGIQLNWLGIVDTNGKWGTSTTGGGGLLWPNQATTTVGYMTQGSFNVCGFVFATTSDNQATVGIADCGDVGYRNRY